MVQYGETVANVGPNLVRSSVSVVIAVPRSMEDDLYYATQMHGVQITSCSKWETSAQRDGIDR